ncbi:MAG TPA: ABC transporter permease [Actinomycetaceae bacterium]|nr:ABC transporter permease [Actinomycetaceae bacterium]
MIRITWALMRHSLPRLIAAGIAITVGTAFIAATLVGSTLIRDATYGAMLAEFKGADVVASGHYTPGSVVEVGDQPGVVEAVGRLDISGVASVQGREAWSAVTPVLPDGFTNAAVITGQLPRGAQEVALSANLMERLGATIGDELELNAELLGPHDPSEPWQPPAGVTADLRIVGELANPSPLAGPGSEVLVTQGTVDEWLASSSSPTVYGELLVVGAPGVAAEDIAAQVGQLNPDAVVQTATELAQARTADVTGQNAIFTALILAFAAVAMFVAAIVVTNTFQVIVAQRTRTLALLRATGATRTQVRRSVLMESTLLGVAASALGIGAGIGLAGIALAVLHRQDLRVPLPESISVTPIVVIVPLLTGALATWLAAIAPARAATRVAPVAALRPAEAPRVRRGSRGRLIAALALLVVGGGMVAAGPVVASTESLDPDTALFGGVALGVFGGVISFAGVMLGAIFVVAPLVRLLGRALGALGGGATLTLATANAARNPHRTSATTTALVIGVGLVTLMSTGAASAQASLDEVLDDFYPADVFVTSTNWADDGTTLPLSPTQRATVAESPDVSETTDVAEVVGALHGPAGQIDWFYLEAVDPTDAVAVLRREEVVAGLADDTILLSARTARELGVPDGGEISVAAADPAGGGTSEELTLRVVVTAAGDGGLITLGTAGALWGSAEPTSLWVRLADGVDQVKAIGALEAQLTELRAAGGSEPVPRVTGPAAERQSFEQVIDALLAIVVGLLAVAVVIALIGVANTLSLSVIERRRESAVLRAMGLTRGQLRAMLATEGVLLALVGAGAGAVLGMAYGWAGTAILLGQSEHVRLVAPWGHLGAIVVVAVVAGLLASVLPARSAARTPPVAALALD